MLGSYRALRVLNQATSCVKVSDKDIDPASAKRCPDGPVFAGSAGHAHTSGHSHEIGGSNTQDALVEWCFNAAAIHVEEPKADIADRSGAAELVLFVFGERVTALPQQRRRLQAANAYEGEVEFLP